MGRTGDFRSGSVSNPDVNGNYWNSVSSSAFFPNLLDIGGSSTSVAFGFAPGGDGGHDSFNGPAGTTFDPAQADVDTVALGNLGVGAAVYDYYVNSRFEIQGLDPSKVYNLTLFGSHKFNDNDTTRYTIYTDNTYSTPVAFADLLVGSGPNHNRDTVATISGVAPQTGNILYVGFAGAGGGNGYLNAFRLTAIPEPSTLLLTVSSVALVFCYRRRQ